MIKTKKLFLLLAMLLMSIGASAQSQLKGDVNNDGKVDEADITAVIEIMKNGGGVTDSNDVNKDGKVDVADIVAIIGIIKNGGGSSGETKYYWYAGPDMLTSATVPGSGTVYPMTTTADNQIGWHIIEGEPTSIETGELENPTDKINWVLAVPTKFGLNRISNGEDITDFYDVTTVTCADGVEYIVFKQGNKTRKIDVTFVKGSTSGEVFDPNSYYIYIGLNRPTSDTDIAADLASNNTPLIEGMASMGWRSIGQDISQYSKSNPAFNGGANTVCLDKNFNNVTCYVAIPVGMGIFDGLGNESSWTVDQTNVTIKGHQYNVYKTVLEGEFGNSIYSKGGSSSGETKYYWYAGPDMLTSATVPGSGTVYPMTTTSDSQTGWHVIEGEPTSIETGDLANPEKINWVLAIPTKFGLNHISNGVLDITSGYDVSTVTTADGVEYIVFKQLRATKRIDVTFVKGSTSGEVFDPNSYYIYIGLNRPTSDTDIAADLASNNTPLHEDMASMGWRKIGPDISIYNSSNPAYNGGGYKSTVCLDKNFNNVTCYVAIPVGMGIFDGLGNEGGWTIDQANITIKGHQYNVYKTVLEGEFGEIIYYKGGSSSGETNYYWYAGPDMLTSATVPGSGKVYPMTTTADSQTGWHVIEGEPTSIETGDLANPEKINWVLAVPTALNLNHLSNGDDITDLYDVTTVTCADGIQYKVFTQVRASKRIDVTFVK